MPSEFLPHGVRPPVRGMVFDIMRYCVHDGPGIRTTVFLKGCPLRCIWCHNPEGQEKRPELSLRDARCIRCGGCHLLCPNDAILEAGDSWETDRTRCKVCGECLDACYAGAREMVGREMTPDEVLNEVVKDIAFYDESDGGVTFSGGEPLFQPEFLGALLTAAKKFGIHTAVETTGYATPEVVTRIAADTDLFLYDLKIMDESLHRKYTGVSNRPILQNLGLLSRMDARVIVRIPLIPGINDDSENMTRSATYIAGLGTIREVHLLPFHKIGQDKYTRLAKENPMRDPGQSGGESLEKFRSLMEGFGLSVTLGG